MAQHNILGRKGEQIAVQFLEKEGYVILDTNWRYNGIEIDIVAKNSGYIVFVEVKTRASLNWGQPEDSVNDVKIRRIVNAADYYMQECDCDLPCRFDIISVVAVDGNILINHIDDAFGAPIE